MTVKEIFDLRKQGKIEEAYEAIRPMYAVHQGKYTTLCMFWTASDILKKRLKEQRFDEAEKIFKALLRVLPNIEDRSAQSDAYSSKASLKKDGKARSSILYEAVTLDKEIQSFSMLDFLSQLQVEQLTDEDWRSLTPGPSPKGEGNNYQIPSVAQQLLTCAFHEIQEDPTADNALKAMPLLQEAMRRYPHNKNCQRYMAVVYRIMGETEKAVSIYRQLLKHNRDSYLYAELAELTDDAGQKAALYCRAIQNQRQEKFRTGYRLKLARLLLDRDKSKAAYELQKCIDTRKTLGFGVTREMQQMLQQLSGIQPATDADQQTFYKKMTEKYL